MAVASETRLGYCRSVRRPSSRHGKKGPALDVVHPRLLHPCEPDIVAVVISGVDEAAVDDMGSCVGKQKEPRWLWPALEHRPGQVVAYVLGRRKEDVLLALNTLLEPLG